MPRMTARGEPPLAGRLTLRTGGRKVVLAKRAAESERHVLLKAIVFGLYVDAYPDLTVERPIGHRYKPDLVVLAPDGAPVFWAECGETGRDKLALLVKTLPSTHLVVAKQVASLDPYEAMLRRVLAGVRRTAPIDLINAPTDAARFIGADGGIAVRFADVRLIRLVNDAGPPSGRREARR